MLFLVSSFSFVCSSCARSLLRHPRLPARHLVLTRSSVESAPFKLTAEFVDLMDGPSSVCFKEFREVCRRLIQGILTVDLVVFLCCFM